jgi:hypothetical protein
MLTTGEPGASTRRRAGGQTEPNATRRRSVRL